MPRFIKSSSRYVRKIAGRQQKQPGIPAAAPSASTLEGASATGSKPVQQERPRDSSLSSSPANPQQLPAAQSDSSATGTQLVQQEQPRDSSVSSSPANPQQMPAAQSLWDRAYVALAKENPDLVKEYDELLAKEQMATESVPNETTPLRLPAPHGHDTRSGRPTRQVQLNTVIQNGLQRMEVNKTTYAIAGHEFVLADKIAQVSNVLLWVKDWIGSAVKDSPEASLAWSAVCLFLPLFTNPTTAAEANRDGFVYVTSRMRYYVALEPLLSRLGRNARVNEAAISAANDHIVDLYKAILEFQLSSVLRFFQSRLRTYVRDIVPSRDWEQTRFDIKTREDTVNNDLGQINQLVARQELEVLNETSEGTRATLENCLSVATQQLAILSEQLTVLKQQQAAQEDAKHERLLAKQLKCLQLFYLTQNGNGATYDWYKGRVELRVEGTCRWFLQHKHFQQWLSQESGPLLVSADPGCGKSVLAKYLIDHELAQQSATICYFFFKDQDQNTVCQALCALLHQLFSAKLALIQHAMELYNRKGENLVRSEESLWNILRDAVRDPQAGPVIFVIDALDECDESQLSSLITNLERIFGNQQLANVKFKVLMTSRPYQQVVNKFNSLQDIFQHIRIPGEEEFETIGQEINSVIQHRVNQLAKNHQLSDQIKSSLARKLLTIDHRTYLWVYLVFDFLDKGFKQTDDGINTAIKTLPESVNQAYDQILNRSQEAETVKKALCTILAARRPLTLSEMNIAMNLDGEGRGRSIYDLDLEQNKPFKTRLRTLCGLFVNVHHDKVYFLHQTAREFLLQSSAPTTVSSNLQWHHSITTRHAHTVLAEICILYLDMLSSTDAVKFRRDDHHGALVQYSVEFWGDHFREAEFEKGSVMVDLASGLCSPDSTNHSQWASIMPERYDTRPQSSTNVLVASRLGLTSVTESLLSRAVDIEAKTFDGMTALMLAAEHGHEAVTRVLLELRADIEANINGATALIFASRSRHEAITRLLLENGANVEAKDSRGRTALVIATEYGHEAITRLLLEHGANVEAKDELVQTVLMVAAGRKGHEGVVRLLLAYGANVEAKNDIRWTALLCAANFGHEAITRLLLENGADVEAKHLFGWTPLMVAAKSGHISVVRLLLENGAAVEARDKDGKTAFMCAAETGREVVARLLLENGAAVEARDNHGKTVLMFAAEPGRGPGSRFAPGAGLVAVIQLLLENGAAIEARNEDGKTALMLAAEAGRETITRLLLENGAAVEARDKYDKTALMLATQAGCEAITRLLVDYAAQIEAKDVEGGVQVD